MRVPEGRDGTGAATAAGDAEAPRVEDLTLKLVEERLDVAKRRVAGGVVRISTTTDTVEEVAEVELDRYRVEVTRVPIGRIVDELPLARSEGDITIVPVVEERFVVVKQLFLKEEVHVRHVVEREVRREPVTLRRQRATVERGDGAAPGPGEDALRGLADGAAEAGAVPV